MVKTFMDSGFFQLSTEQLNNKPLLYISALYCLVVYTTLKCNTLIVYYDIDYFNKGIVRGISM